MSGIRDAILRAMVEADYEVIDDWRTVLDDPEGPEYERYADAAMSVLSRKWVEAVRWVEAPDDEVDGW